MKISTLLAAALALAACNGKTTIPAAKYPPKTTLALASSARCTGGKCSCRPLDSDDGQKEENVPAGQKRFELRIPKSTSAIWVSVGGRGVFYKGPELIEPVCFYVDLPPGVHPIVLQSEDREAEVGLQTGLTVYEHAVHEDGTTHWYRSVHVVCGGGASKCTRDEIANWAKFQRGLPRGVLDPCGSVMARGVAFSGRRAQKGDNAYVDLTVRLKLKVYAFKPYRPSGSPECKAPIKNR